METVRCIFLYSTSVKTIDSSIIKLDTKTGLDNINNLKLRATYNQNKNYIVVETSMAPIEIDTFNKFEDCTNNESLYNLLTSKRRNPIYH